MPKNMQNNTVGHHFLIFKVSLLVVFFFFKKNSLISPIFGCCTTISNENVQNPALEMCKSIQNRIVL